MTTTPLDHFLDDWAKTARQRRIAETVALLAESGKAIGELVARGPLAGTMATVVATNRDGDVQKELDRLANDRVIVALSDAPVSYIASEELDDALETQKPDAPLIVAVDPLDGSSNIGTNAPLGTIFSILPRAEEAGDAPDAQFCQAGTRQLAAGYILYGPHTALALTLGEGTHLFTLDPSDGRFKLTGPDMTVPAEAAEFAINTSNYRHWDERIRGYVNDCLEGAEGPRRKDFNTRWLAAVVAECHRILMRGGVYLYPGDAREGYRSGRLRLIYEANPLAFLIEQAGGAATTGLMRILDLVPTDIHQRVPLIFGSADEVRTLEGYYEHAEQVVGNLPLFGRRGLFRKQTM